MRRRVRDERGISTVIAVVSLLGLFGATMLSLDYGNTVSTRRNLITGTDSTAMYRARLQAKAPIANGSCPIGWQDYLLRNSGAYVTGSDFCTIHGDPAHPGTGYVVVEARKQADTRFGGLFGIGNTQPISLSAAQYGYVTAAKGLRPMGFCASNGHIDEWLDLVDREPDGSTITPAEQATYDALRGNPASDHPVYPGAGVVHRMWFNKTWKTPGNCGPGASGNWGWFDFNAGGNPNKDIRDWLQDGYDGLVGVWDPPPGTCTQPDTPEGCVNVTTGMRLNSESSELNALIANGTKFHVPIYDWSAGSGNNGKYEVWGFLGVRLWGWNKDSSDGYFDMEFFELQLSGKCCSPTGADTGQIGVKLCEVDHDGAMTDTSIAARCGQ